MRHHFFLFEKHFLIIEHPKTVDDSLRLFHQEYMHVVQVKMVAIIAA
jgi:hypothetical protein